MGRDPKTKFKPDYTEKMEEDEIVISNLRVSNPLAPLGRSTVARKGVGLSVGLMFAAYVHGK